MGRAGTGASMAGKNGTGKAAALANFRPQRVNANRHNARGVGMLTRAMQRSGYVAPMTAAADGEVIDGSARLEVAADVFDGAEPIVVDHDGTRPIIMRRTDIPNATDPRAVEISLAANRIAQVDLEWDADVLAAIAEAGEVDLSGMWRDEELAAVLAALIVPYGDTSTDREHQGVSSPWQQAGGADRVAFKIGDIEGGVAESVYTMLETVCAGRYGADGTPYSDTIAEVIVGGCDALRGD